MTPAPIPQGAGGARTGSFLVVVGAVVMVLALFALILWQTMGPAAPGDDLTWETPPQAQIGPSDGGGAQTLPVRAGGTPSSAPEPLPEIVAPEPSAPPPAGQDPEQAGPSGDAAASGAAATSSGASGTVTAAPTSLQIPAAGISQPLVHLGLASNGTISPPRGTTQYFTGYDRVAPGRNGTAVIAAHVSYGGAPDAFASLHRAAVGDAVSIAYADGSTRTFTVRQTFIADKDALTSSPTVWGAHPQSPRIAIITCDPALSYDDAGHALGNLVVIAE